MESLASAIHSLRNTLSFSSLSGSQAFHLYPPVVGIARDDQMVWDTLLLSRRLVCNLIQSVSDL